MACGRNVRFDVFTHLYYCGLVPVGMAMSPLPLLKRTGFTSNLQGSRGTQILVGYVGSQAPLQMQGR
jgi:hypothetical protein